MCDHKYKSSSNKQSSGTRKNTQKQHPFGWSKTHHYGMCGQNCPCCRARQGEIFGACPICK